MKPFQIILCASVLFVIGILVAYHNTASLGYGKDYLIYYDDEGFEFMEQRIDYKDVREKVRKITEYVPDEFITI